MVVFFVKIVILCLFLSVLEFIVCFCNCVCLFKVLDCFKSLFIKVVLLWLMWVIIVMLWILFLYFNLIVFYLYMFMLFKFIKVDCLL